MGHGDETHLGSHYEEPIQEHLIEIKYLSDIYEIKFDPKNGPTQLRINGEKQDKYPPIDHPVYELFAKKVHEIQLKSREKPTNVVV